MHRRVSVAAATAALIVAALTGCSGSSDTGSAPTRTPKPHPTQYCPPRFHHIGSVAVRSFCGSASATAYIRGHRFRVRGGRCQIRRTFVAVNIGTVVLGNTDAARHLRKHRRYVAAFVGRLPGARHHASAPTDGSYPLTFLTIVDHGHRYVVKSGTAVLSDGRYKGRFTAQLRGGGRAHGNWAC